MAQERTKPSAVEDIKDRSRALRGDIAAELADLATPFTEESYQLLKFHGSYQGFDRDTATARKQQGLAKEYQLMVRAKIPGGRLTATQYLALDALADAHADGSLRITTRQGIQFHGILKGALKPSIRAINDALLTTLGACGDVVRNVVTHPAPIADAVHRRLEADAKAISARFGWTSRAYHEIWLDGEVLPLDQDGADEEDPIYGRHYLPRKFKIGLATPADNSIDVLTNDLAIIALFDGDTLQGYNLALGGGLGQTHNRADTFPRLATPIAFVGPDDLIRGIEAVISVHREHGNRADRKRARLKYVVEDKGAAWVKAELERFYSARLEDARPTPAFQVPNHMGWHPQGDGRWYLGLPVSSGRIRDSLRTALREVIGGFGIDPVLTPEQDILLSNITEEDRPRIEQTLRAHGVALAEDLPPLALTTLACPALPTCGLALAEAERVRDPFVAAIHGELARHGLGEERLSLRITGCPNGCARPSTAEIGLVGRTPGHYAIYVGGAVEGTRLNDKLLERVPQDDVPPTLGRLFALWAAERAAGEGFGDFALRTGLDRLRAALEAAPAAAE